MKKRFLTLILTLTAMLMFILGLSACKGESSTPNGGLDNKVKVELTKENLATYIEVDEEIDGKQVHLVPSRFPIYYYMYVNPSINVIATPIEEGYVCQDIEITVEVTYMCYRWNESDLDIDHSQYQTEQFTIKASETGSGSVRVLSKKNSYVQQYYITMASATVKSVKGNIWVDCVHEWDGGTITIPATCTETGIKTIKCGRCEKIKEETLPSLGHDYPEEGMIVSEPTCTTNGKKEYVCVRCDNVKSETIAMLGHDYPEEGTVVQEATCLMTGKERFICSRCEVTKEETIAALGHSWETTWSKDDTYHWIECNICDAIKDKSIHNYGDNALCSVCGQQDNASQGVEYKLSESGLYYVLWSVGECSDTNVIIASSYNGKPVKTISESAFYENTTMTSVTIPKSVTKIEPWAFYGCTSLTSITISDNVTSIGEGAFQNCRQINEIKLGKGLNTIEKNLFANCSALTNITIPNSVKSIGSNAFSGCRSLATITIPNSVTSIGDSVFSGCSELTEITLPFVGASKTVTSASSLSLFGYIFGTSSYAGGESTRQRYSYSSSNKTYYIPSKLKSVTITGGNILFGAFSNCSGLTGINIPDSVKSIGSNAFSGCNSLTSIKIPNSVTSIGNYAFSNCYSLTSVTIGNGVTSIGEEAFDSCTSLTKVNYTGTIDSWAQIEFSDITANPLYYAEKLYINNELVTNVVLTTATKISNYAFSNCTSLTSVTICNSVTTIGEYAFHGCNSLTSIEIPSSVTNIGSNIFLFCSRLENITVDFKNPSYKSEGGVLYNKEKSQIVCVPWAIKAVVLPDTVTSIGSNAFSNCSSLTSIVIPNSVTSIGNYAFSNCYSLTSVEYKGSIDEWVEIKFSENSSNPLCYASKLIIDGKEVTEVNITTATKINNYAFRDCSGLINVIIGDSVTSIGDSAFRDCDSLTSIVIPDSVTSIGDSAFRDCDSLTSIVIPNSVTSIGHSAFYSCDSLTSIEFSDTSTWYRTTSISNWSNKTGGTQTSVTNSSTNATYFKPGFYQYYWYKK